MTLVWHILKKDIIRLKVPLAIWALVLVAKVAFYASIAGVFGSPSLEWLGRMTSGPELALRVLVEPLLAFILLGWLVYEDPLVGVDAFWPTRPISGTRLLAAKVAAAALLFVALPVVVNVPWWLACGFGAREVLDAALPMATGYGIVVVIAMAAASATNAFPRFFLWTIAGIAAVLAVHLTVAVCLGNGLGFHTTQDLGEGQFLSRAVVFLACIVAVSVEIILHQFLPRRTRRAMIALIVATVGASAGICNSSLNLFADEPWFHRPSAAADLPDQNVRLEIPKGAGQGPVYQGTMVIPMVIHGLKDNEAAFWATYGEWQINGTPVWRIGGWGGRSAYQMLDDRKHRMLSLSPGPDDYTAQTMFSLPRALAQRLSRENASFHAKVRLDIVEGRVLAELPIRDQSYRHDAGSLTISSLVSTPTQTTLVITNRLGGVNFSHRFEVFWPRDVTLAFANRAENLLVTGRQEDLEPAGLQLNMVQVVSKKVTFKYPQGTAEKGDTRLVLFNFETTHLIYRTLDMDPFQFTMTASELPKAKASRKH